MFFWCGVTFNNHGGPHDENHRGAERICDVQCKTTWKENLKQLSIYGMDLQFTNSMEGEVYYPRLKVNRQAWKKNNFYATTSFQSDVPFTYFQLNINRLGPGKGLQIPAMPYSDVIKGADFHGHANTLAEASKIKTCQGVTEYSLESRFTLFLV
mmetsp:Transcript_26612/g.30724  ORF Transcript_26612/g.30724 Transcript_26612/m.30724 type:complete len:154 (+) Transcript_26612:388-849(+)